MEPTTRDLNKLRAQRMKRLRRHALAIAMLIDETEPEDLMQPRPGDVVQLLPGQPNAHALMRVTEVRERNRLRGHLLAISYRWKEGMRLSSVETSDVRKIGHARAAIDPDDYPLHEAPPISFEQADEAARLGWLKADAEIRERRAKAARARRGAAKQNGQKGPEKNV